MKAKIKNLLLLSLVLICISSCAPLIQAVQPAILETVPISQGTAIGQTITANFNGLQEIRLHLTQGDAGNGFIELSLFDRANKDQLIETSRVPLNQINEPGWYSFSFPPLAHSNQNDYYIELIPSGSGTLEVASGYTESYIDGSLFVDSIPAGAAWYRFYTDDNCIRGYINETIPAIAIAVHKNYRLQGIGEKMIEWLIDHASKHNIQKLSLMVSKDNRAIRLYRKCGFLECTDTGDSLLMLRKTET